MSSSIRFTHRFRWVASDATNDLVNVSTISAAQLLGILVQGQALGGSSSIMRSARILDAELWGIYAGAPAAGLSANYPVTISIEYPTSANVGPGGPDMRRTDTTLGSANLAHVRYPPPKGSLQSMWMDRSSVPFLQLTYPRGAIFDLTLEIVLEDAPNVVNVGTTGAVSGQNYLLAIDWGGGGFFWRPVSYNTTT